GRLSLSYDKLIRLSEGLDVGVAQLFASPAAGPGAVSGRRSINRLGEWESVPTGNYDYRYLSTDIARKKFIPIIVELRSRSFDQFGELVQHSGEEFVYVLEGEVEIHTSLYAPLVLKTGESVYLDSTMGHAYIARGKGPCKLLAVCSASERDLRAVVEEDSAAAQAAVATPKPAQHAARPKRVARRR